MGSEELIPFICANIVSFPSFELSEKNVYLLISFYLHNIAHVQLLLFILISITLVSRPHGVSPLPQLLPNSPSYVVRLNSKRIMILLFYSFNFLKGNSPNWV